MRRCLRDRDLALISDGSHDGDARMHAKILA